MKRQLSKERSAMRSAGAWFAVAATLLLATTAASAEQASSGAAAVSAAVYDKGFEFGRNGHAASIMGRADFASDAEYHAYLQGIADGYARYRIANPSAPPAGDHPANCGT